MQEGKVVVWWVLQTAEERREAKGKGERERYTELNAEFQRIARRDKKAFLNEQRKRENNRMERLEIFSRKLEHQRYTSCKMGMIKDRNGKDLSEKEEIKKRWQEYTEELKKKILMTWITMMVWSLV